MSNEMTLSQAIRKGIEQFPTQAIAQPFNQTPDGMSACVLGCAVWSVFGSTDGFMSDSLADKYPELTGNTIADFPGWRELDNLREQIEFANDIRRWSRELIADILEANGL